MRARFVFLVGAAAVSAAVALAVGASVARAQDLGGPFRREPTEAPKAAPKLTKAPAIKQAVEPVYPPDALAAKLTADVSMMVDIDAEGKVTKVTVTKPVGQGFDEAAHDAVMQYLFSPAEVDGKPSPIRIEYTLHFVPKEQPPESPDGGADATVDAEPPPPPPPPDVVVATGRLREKGTRDPLPGAEVAVVVRTPEGIEKPAVVVGGTDEDGRFVVKGQPGVGIRVIVTEQRHDPCIRDLIPTDVNADKPKELDCLVPKSGAPPYETTVRAKKPAPAVTRYELAQPELKVVPGTFGDPLRVVQNLPGIARSPFGLGALVIRGASPNDSGIYVEGHRIPLLYHFLVGPGVLAPELIDRIDFFPGNFGVTYGRVTAGVVDVGIRTSASPRLHGDVDINLLHSAVYIEGPLGNGWSGSISARRSYIDAILPLVLPSNVTTAAPVYWDYQAGVNRTIPGGKLSLFAFGSNDSLKVISTDPRQGNVDLGLEMGFHKVFAIWTAALGKWTNKLSPAYGYERLKFGVGPFAINQSAQILALRDDLSRPIGQHLTLRLGIDAEKRFSDIFFNFPLVPDTRLYGLTVPKIQPLTIPLDTNAAGLYADATWDVGGGVTVIPGVRGDAFRYVGENRFTFDPRLVVRYKQNAKQTWKAGAGIYHQMVDPQLLNPQLGNPNLPPIWADQYSVGFLRQIIDKVTLDTTLYYVRRHDMPVPPPPFTSNGQGRSYGMELILKHEFTERFFGWIAYTLSRSEQTVYAVNAPMQSGMDGTLQDPTKTTVKWFPTDYDQTHNLIAVASYALKKWRFGARFRLVSGAPETPMLEGAYDAEAGMDVCRTGPTNSARKPTFSQLDIRIDRTWTFKAWQLGLYADLNNVYNAQNPEGTIYDYRCRTSIPIRGVPFYPILGIKGMF
jgi:TonB family protein